MAFEILPPSPNWYLTSASSCSEDGTLAFATKSSVLLLDVTVSPPTFAGSLSGHAERVTSVAFRRTVGVSDGDARLCASAGDDGIIKIWDTKNKSVLSEKKCQENKITALDWSRANTDIVVAGDEKGYLIYWDIKSSKKDDAKLLRPEKGCIYSLTCSPHDSKIVALGYRDGKILIVDALSKKNQVLQHLRGHNDEIQSIAWAPFLGEDAFLKNKSDDEDSDKHTEPGCLLISGSRDKTIRVWSTSQGRLLKVMNLPPRGGGGQRPRDRGDEGGMKSRVWVSLYWPQDKPSKLVSSSHGGDVIVWDLSKPSQPKWEILGGPGDCTHQRSVFNVSGRQGDLDRVITTSMDRQVICWNLVTLQSEWSLPTFGGFVYCIVPSPLDPARLAVGVGDNMIRVWNTGARGKVFDVITLWQGIKSKVTVVSWHPTRENSLAYGTDDGRVGIFNVSVPNKPPQQFWTYHKKTIYSLCWGPPCPKPSGNHSQSHHIYSCGGEGLVYQHNPTKLEQESVNINTLIKQTNNYKHLLPQRSDVTWRSDGKAVAIGNEDGSIEVFASPDLHHLCTIHVQGKIINCLKWYPYYEETSQSESGKFKTNQSELKEALPDNHQEATGQTASEETHKEFEDLDDCDPRTDPAMNGTEKLSKETGDNFSHETGVILSEKTCQSQDSSESSSEKTGIPQDSIQSSSEKTDVPQDSSESLSEKTDVDGQSERRYWLASGSNDYEVEIYDLSSVLGKEGKPLTVPITSSYRTLTGHTGRVTNMTWSPHGDGRLVSTSYDNSAQVWDVLKGEPIANFRGHMGRVFSCAWSCFDPDLIMTGGEDFCLMKWNVSKVNHTKPPKSSRKPFKRAGKKGKKPQQNKNNQEGNTNNDIVLATGLSEATDEQSKVDEPVSNTELNDGTLPANQTEGDTMSRGGEVEDARQLLERKKQELLAQVEEIEGRIGREKEEQREDDQATSVSEPNEQECIVRERSDALSAILDRLAPKEEEIERDQDKGTFKDMTVPGSKKGRHKRFKSLFPSNAGQDNRGKAFLQQDCVQLANLKQGSSSNEISDQPPLHIGLFVDRKMAVKMLNDEVCQHDQNGSYDQRYQLHLWKGNILQTLREAINKGQLTDWLVAMAPLAGHDVWLQTCDAYAKQLESQDQIHRAVSFYLISHQVYKAIAILKKNSMFRDAITLAQVRLLPSDPVLHDLYLAWANHLESSNSYEPAARCYLALNQPINAIKLLARKGDVTALGTALHVAILSGCTEEGLVVSIATRFLNLSLLTGQWKQALDIFSLDKKYQAYASLVMIYELLVCCLTHEGYLTLDHDISHTDIYTESIPDIQWKKPSDNSCMWSVPTLDGAPLVKTMLARAGLSCDQSHDLQRLRDQTSYDLAHDINKVLRCAAQKILHVLSSSDEVMMGHVVEALELCHTSCHPAVAIGVLQLTMFQGEESVMMSSDQHDMNPKLLNLKAQFRVTQLYHLKTRMKTSRSYGPSGLDKGKELQDDGVFKGLPGKQDGQAGDDVIKEQETHDDSLMLNPRTERYLFQSGVLRDSSWTMSSSCLVESQDDCPSMTSESFHAANQGLTQEQLVDTILSRISGIQVPALLCESSKIEQERSMNGIDHGRSCPYDVTESPTLIGTLPTLTTKPTSEAGTATERTSCKVLPSDIRSEKLAGSNKQCSQTAEQINHEAIEGTAKNGQHYWAGGQQPCLPDKDAPLISSMRSILINELPSVLSILYSKLLQTDSCKETKQ
ncbi:gem-associated protein 5-like [Lytechinus variegatus]|uniref:gem-associated protein 5-like n=1 Tax=Lytechinus variegatus TaxID=7654 RepID=UPI001BB269F3|nr:gem-associated protein 5-like [Lytechinus variegatus]